MSTPGQKFTVAHDGPLLKYLYEIFPGQSKTGVKNMLSKGQILVNGEQRTAFDHPLSTGDTLLVLPKAISMARESGANAREEVEKTGVKIVWEDNDYIVVDKPSGLLTVSTAKGPPSGQGHLRPGGLRQERAREGHPPKPLEGACHRAPLHRLPRKEARE